MEAKIKENKPYCSKCDLLLNENSSTVDLIKDSNDVRFYLFSRRCLKCSNEMKYCIDLDLEKRYELKTIGRISNIEKE